MPIGVFWDVDGTISNSYALGYSSTNAVLRNHGKAVIDEEDYHLGTTFTTPRRLAWHVTGNPDDPIGEMLGKEFDDLYINLVSTKTAPLYDGIQSLLRLIQSEYPRVQYAALSNACGGYVKAVLRVNDLSHMFMAAIGADDVLAAKPQPDGLLHLACSLNIHPENCIYIGDSPTDGQAAMAAGMMSIGVTWGSHSVENIVPYFTYTVNSVDDLLKQLRQLIARIN